MIVIAQAQGVVLRGSAWFRANPTHSEQSLPDNHLQVLRVSRVLRDERAPAPRSFPTRGDRSLRTSNSLLFIHCQALTRHAATSVSPLLLSASRRTRNAANVASTATYAEASLDAKYRRSAQNSRRRHGASIDSRSLVEGTEGQKGAAL